MRSLIKMEMSRYPVFDVVQLNELPNREDSSRRNGITTHQTSRQQQSKNQTLFGIPSHKYDRTDKKIIARIFL